MLSVFFCFIWQPDPKYVGHFQNAYFLSTLIPYGCYKSHVKHPYLQLEIHIVFFQMLISAIQKQYLTIKMLMLKNIELYFSRYFLVGDFTKNVYKCLVSLVL